MALFKLEKEKARKLASLDLDLEKNLQRLFEVNLNELLGIDFLAHEYSTSFGGRIDTLGVDDAGAPCIIEYKRGQNDNVINQGLSYLKWLRDHKAEFENICKDKNIPRKVDWDSPRVICVAESFNKFDLDTAEVLEGILNVELLRYRIYDDNILYLEPEKQQKVRQQKAHLKVKTTEKLQKDYTIEDHLKKASAEVKRLFYEVREFLLSLDEEIKESPRKLYIAYKLASNFADVEVRSKDIKIFLNVPSGSLVDPRVLARDLTKPKLVGHWGNGDYEVKLTSPKDLDYVRGLIKQSYDLNK